MTSERDSDSFELDDDMLGEVAHQEENNDYDRFLDRVERRARPVPGKRGKAVNRSARNGGDANYL